MITDILRRVIPTTGEAPSTPKAIAWIAWMLLSSFLLIAAVGYISGYIDSQGPTLLCDLAGSQCP